MGKIITPSDGANAAFDNVDPFKADESAPKMADLIRLTPGIHSCWSEMEKIHDKYGSEIFSIVIDQLQQTAPPEIVKQVMRYRYLDERLRKGMKS